jgi:hypothetical protein
VSTTVVLSGHLDVLVVQATVSFLILDPYVGEMHLVIEVREVVVERPITDFRFASIGVPVVVRALAIEFMKPRLVLTLELVVEHDSLHACAALGQAVRFAFVRAVDLDVVFELPLAFDAIPECLMASLVAVTVTLEQASSFFRQRHRTIASAWDANRLNEPLLAQVPEIARARIEWTILMIAEIATGDHSKRPDGSERAGFRAAQRVLALAVAHDRSLDATRQV